MSCPQITMFVSCFSWSLGQSLSGAGGGLFRVRMKRTCPVTAWQRMMGVTWHGFTSQQNMQKQQKKRGESMRIYLECDCKETRFVVILVAHETCQETFHETTNIRNLSLHSGGGPTMPITTACILGLLYLRWWKHVGWQNVGHIK